MSKLQEMKHEHIEEVAHLLARNFHEGNPVWQNFQSNPEEIYNFFVVEVKEHLESQERVRK